MVFVLSGINLLFKCRLSVNAVISLAIILLNCVFQKTTTEEQQSLIAKNVATQSAANDRRKDWLNYVKAGLLVILGTTITLTLGQPLVGTLVRFSFAANVPSFLISYVVIPLALNFGQAVRAISSAREKTEKAISLMLSEVCILINFLIYLIS